MWNKRSALLNPLKYTVFGYIAKKWRACKNFIVGNKAYESDYKSVIGANRQYEGYAKVLSVSEVFHGCSFILHYENNDTISTYGFINYYFLET